jgi:hypothetical protein
MLVGFYAQEAEVWTRQAMTASVAVLTGAGRLRRYATMRLIRMAFGTTRLAL